MIAKKFRFHGYGSLKFVYSKGKTVRTQFLALKYTSNPRRKESRLAVVVSKKVTKRSPARNHIRRRLYEAMRLRWDELSPGYDLVLSVFDERVGTVSHEKLSQMIDDILSQAELRK